MCLGSCDDILGAKLERFGFLPHLFGTTWHREATNPVEAKRYGSSV